MFKKRIGYGITSEQLHLKDDRKKFQNSFYQLESNRNSLNPKIGLILIKNTVKWLI